MTSVYFDRDQLDLLRALSDASAVPMAELVRQGVDLLLEKTRGTVLPGQLDIPSMRDAHTERRYR